ncbi:hypothetical protein [Acinetobacter bereziniae]|uniref:Uncharacterized protein n=1 Tax=Acinetobacter bereziniae NIPH 3 TaxID=1217651 RepID=N8YPR1_ACIBZ|nr:hypothetical protein [Acinetobacter bereziniae]ENV21225.1 hypothetical protein F963_02817 [Acinetobacter bereziniae NIPH 3]
MVTSVRTEEELAQAINNNSDIIEIHGDLAKRTIKIKATGNVAWAIAFGAIAVAMASLLLTLGSGGAGAPVIAATMAFAAPAATATLGLGVAISVGSLVVAAGSIGTAKLLFGKLRNDYVIKDKSENFLVLKKR